AGNFAWHGPDPSTCRTVGRFFRKWNATMPLRCDDTFRKDQPALIVKFGNTTKKHRLLDRDVIVLGRARGCDIGLAAPEISNLHCIISRGQTGFRVRDCGSRAGTHLNGESIQDAPLNDGDVLQIGPFSFEAHIPSQCLPQAIPMAPAYPNELPRL